MTSSESQRPRANSAGSDDSFSIPTEAQLFGLDIPNESIQVPEPGSLHMARPSGSTARRAAVPVLLADGRDDALARQPRSHDAFGASRGVVNLPRRSEVQRRPPRMQPPALQERCPPFAVSPYPVGQPAPPQGDGACGSSEGSCSPSNRSEEGVPHSDAAFSRTRPREGALPPVPRETVPDRARSVPARERDHRARIIYDQVASHHTSSSQASDDPDAAEYPERHLAHHLSAPELPPPWQVAEELGQSGMAAPRYLLVRLGECIPAETGAAPVHRSRLDCGPQWKDFLNYGEYNNPEGVSLEEVLTCPCCLSIFRQPIALPCGHSLCRGCYVRVFSQSTSARRCPLCRTDLPRFDIKVNVALTAVSDALRSFLAVQRPNPRPGQG
mmetsp:Transcript_104453/g.248510  ORF Transcript_104453/g.248510 Transcript_104453/m.248510 type:complete len:385 (+) Transcript_104453:61-1215(+)